MMTAGKNADTCGLSGPARVCARTKLFRHESVGRTDELSVLLQPGWRVCRDVRGWRCVHDAHLWQVVRGWLIISSLLSHKCPAAAGGH